MTELPSTMRCIEISKPGGPEALRLVERPLPRPGRGEVLIKVAAAGVNRPDVLQRKGIYPPPPGASDLPGLEIAGTVVAHGPLAKGLRRGAAVCALVSGGGYAEYCAAPVAQCLPIPKGFDLVQAASLPETFFTVWTNLYMGAKLKMGEWLLVHGGTSGIGTTAIQMASRLGAKVIATANGPDKVKVCEQLGATRGIDYGREDFVEVVRQLTDGKGVDVVLDMVGGDYIARDIKALAVEGRLVSIAFLRGSKVEIDLMPVMQKRLILTGSTLRPRSVAKKGVIARALHRHVWPLLGSGAIKPVIHARFPLAKAGEAHALMETNRHIGKIVLEVS